MQTHLIEASNGYNWGKFAVARFDTEWTQISTVTDLPLLRLSGSGWTNDQIWVMDLQTREAAAFTPGGHAANDLNKHQIWVCPLYEPFLAWLYQQDLTDITQLPHTIHLDTPGEFRGHRRPGPDA